jgi:hypothetical protein
MFKIREINLMKIDTEDPVCSAHLMRIVQYSFSNANFPEIYLTSYMIILTHGFCTSKYITF